jgi:drug/metabolite transporter (DMT)-like permease
MVGPRAIAVRRFGRPGVAFALAAAVLFGLATPFAKMLVGSIDPVLMAGLLYLGSGGGLLLLRAIWVNAGREAPLSRRDLPFLAAAVIAGGLLGPLLLMWGLRGSAASVASLLLNLEGVFTALLAWFVFHENFDRRVMAGMAAIVAGGAVLSWSDGGSTLPLASAAIAGACLCWAHEPATTRLLAGGVLMAAGVWLHLTERHEHEDDHEGLTHSHRHVHDEHHLHEHEPGVDPREPHTHEHTHEPLMHRHPHYPDLHHRHRHGGS